MGSEKIVLIGGPSTGKSSIIESLTRQKYQCMPEISREVTRRAKEDGIDQLFLTDSLKFSELLLKGRINQFKAANALSSKYVFIDRGIPDVTAYMDYFGQEYPEYFSEANKNFIYDKIFILPIWDDIYTTDGERFEEIDLAKGLQKALQNTYESLGYDLIEVPKTDINRRIDFILAHL
ncbi:MAG: AAA family ATPase [Psychroflexus sp.]|uniref:AAA family ATPase n=1 Tax=Psychroflexus sp. S27 TaxID=1982757 RepID=UPI000C2A2BC8|nr:ATP-binding protein [Psychroflexus sp. S27]PJX20709.1 ATPase [Psychroflexus sp. S27]